jgi:hypothetical protein
MFCLAGKWTAREREKKVIIILSLRMVVTVPLFLLLFGLE